MADGNNDILISEVQEAEGGIHSDLAQDLQEAADIAARFPDNSEIIQKYQELRLATIGALKDLRIETSEQLREVQLSLTGENDMSTLGDTGTISNDEKLRIEALQVSLESEVTWDALKEKYIWDLSSEEAKTLLTLTHAEYENFWSSMKDKLMLSTLGISISQYNEIDSSEKMNIFQQQLISKIFTENGGGTFEQGYSHNWLLAGFDSQKWNYTISVEDFEAKIEAGESLDRSTLSTYLLYKAENASSPRAFMKEFSDTFGSRKEKVQNLLANGSDNMHIERLLTLLSGETYQVPTGPESMIAFISNGSFSDSVFDFLGTAQGYISTGIENILSYLKNPETHWDTSETLIPLLWRMTQYISDIGDDSITGQLQTQLQWVFQDILWDISDPNSFISRNLANTPLSRFEAGTELYRVALAAKTQEYQRELRTKINENADIILSRSNFLTLIQEQTGCTLEEAITFFDELVRKIEENPSDINSDEELKAILSGQGWENALFQEHIATILEQAQSLAHQRQAETLQLGIEEIIALAADWVSPEEAERIIVLRASLESTAEIIDTIRTLPDWEILAWYMQWILSEEDFRNSFYIPEEIWTETESLTLEETINSLWSNWETTLEEETWSIEDQVTKALDIALDPNASDTERQEALTSLSETGEITATEAQVDVSTTVLTTSEWLTSPVAENIREQATQKVEEIISTPEAGGSRYIQEQVNTLRATLGEDNPLVVRITNAQEEGIQKACAKQSNQDWTVAQLPPSARNFYNDTILRLWLSESEISTLTPMELKVIKGSDIARESFLNFRQTLVDLNLESIWQFRNQIFNAIGSLDFTIRDGNYIWTNEMNIFLSKVMYATTGNDTYKDIPRNFQEIQSKIIQDNKVGVIWWIRDIEGIGDGAWVIENRFRILFAPRNAWEIRFNFAAFQDALRNPTSENLVA